MNTLPNPGALVAGKYRIETLLGEGGMGAVFRARHELMDKPVALKWLKPDLADSTDAKSRFLREARAAARIRHPNVVDVYDVGVHEGALFMVMELLEGESLGEIIERGDVPISKAIHYLVGAMRGVAAAHASGITHRDIKPENIFVVHDRAHPDGMPKILDFGISKLHDEQLGSPYITQSGLAIGTPVYMSIEQMNGSLDIDHRTDIYAFGVLLYQLFAGRLPFDGDSVMEIVLKIATERPPLPSAVRPELSADVDRIVMKAMAYSRDDRYSDLHALISELSTLSTSGTLLGNALQAPATLLQPTPGAPVSRSGRAPGGRILASAFRPAQLGELTRSAGKIVVPRGPAAALLVAVGVLTWIWTAADESPLGATSPVAPASGAGSVRSELPAPVVPVAPDVPISPPEPQRPMAGQVPFAPRVELPAERPELVAAVDAALENVALPTAPPRAAQGIALPRVAARLVPDGGVQGRVQPRTQLPPNPYGEPMPAKPTQQNSRPPAAPLPSVSPAPAPTSSAQPTAADVPGRGSGELLREEL